MGISARAAGRIVPTLACVLIAALACPGGAAAQEGPAPIPIEVPEPRRGETPLHASARIGHSEGLALALAAVMLRDVHRHETDTGDELLRDPLTYCA